MKKGMLVLFIFILFVSACSNEGTETGNPKVYSNDSYGVAVEYDEDWNATDNAAKGRPVSTDCDTCEAAPADVSGGIDTSDAPSTKFSDGASAVEIFYVTFSEEPESLLSYLGTVFAERDFEAFSNSRLSGLAYDNPEPGETGGDLQEYYFLQGTTLLYVVTDLFEENNGIARAATVLKSLRFE